MTQPGTAQRLSIVLDTRIPLEALVLNRLRYVPEMRRQEWLRGLLTQGFRQQCRALRHQPSATNDACPESRAQTPYAHWLSRAAMQQKEAISPATARPECRAVADKGSKPFAALRKVIG